MPITKISQPDAFLAAIANSIAEKGRNNLFGDYLSFAGKEARSTLTTLERADVIASIVNNSIESLPRNQQQILLGWANNMIKGKPTTNERREFLKTGFLLSATFYGSAAMDAANNINDKDFDKLGTTTLPVGIAGAAVHVRAKQMMTETEAIFRKKITSWLKEKYEIDFTLPPEKNKGMER